MRFSLPTPEVLARARQVHHLLEAHYGVAIWQDRLPVLDQLVNTILSQNTNDQNRDRAFVALRQQFSSWEAVRDAPLNAVVNAIRSSGLAQQKGVRIQQILKTISAEHGDLSLNFLPELSANEVRSWLTSLPGVGPKTAAIVMQYALGLPAFAVDTHIYRISERLALRPPQLSANDTHQLMEYLLEPQDFASDHLNLIRLGREVCRARHPLCGECPLNKICPSASKIE